MKKITVIKMLFAFVLSTIMNNAFSQSSWGRAAGKSQHQQFFKPAYAGKKLADGSVTNVSLSFWKNKIISRESVWTSSSNEMVYDNYESIIGGYHLGLDGTLPDFVSGAVEIPLPSNVKITSHWVSSDGSQIVSFERHPYVGEKFAAYELNGKYYVIASLFCGNGIIATTESYQAPVSVQTPEAEQGEIPASTIITDSYNTTNNYGGGVQQQRFVQPQMDCAPDMGRVMMRSAGRMSRRIAPMPKRPYRPQQCQQQRPPRPRPPVCYNEPRPRPVQGPVGALGHGTRGPVGASGHGSIGSVGPVGSPGHAVGAPGHGRRRR